MARAQIPVNNNQAVSRGHLMANAVVLIVEDEHVLGSNLKEFFGRRGWNAHLARSGEAALTEFRRVRPAVLLMDYELPDMDGFSILAAARRWAPCPCVMMTAHSSDELDARALTDGVLRVLRKPFSMMEADGWLRQALTSGCAPCDSASAPGRFRSGPNSPNPGAH